MVLNNDKEQKEGFHCKATFNEEDEMSSFPREIEIEKKISIARNPTKRVMEGIYICERLSLIS